MWSNLWLMLSQWCFGLRQQQLFLDNIHGLLEDGIPIHQAVEVVEQITDGAMRAVAEQTKMCLARGQLFADGLHGWYASHTVSIIRTGEQGGAFIEALASAQAALSNQRGLMTTALAVLTYPCLVLGMGCAVAVFLQHSVLSSFAQIKPVAMWPEIGQSLYAWSVFLQHAWWCLLLLVCGGIGGLVWMLRHYTGCGRAYLDRWPVFALYRSFVAAQFMEVLGLMLGHGITLRSALQLSQQHAPSSYVAWHVSYMEVHLSGGLDNIADVLDTGLLHRAELLRLRVVAKGSGFAKALLRLGRQCAKDTQRRTVWSLRVLSGILLMLAAALAAYMILAVYAVGGFIGS